MTDPTHQADDPTDQAQHTPDAVRSLLGKIGASARWSKEDPHDPAGPLPRARAAFDARFYAGIPDDLPAAERDRRAAHARTEYFARLALKSVQARRARKGGGAS